MPTASDEHIDAVRRFNRFYTRRIGVLQEGLLASPFTLAKARVLYELGTRATPTAGDIGEALGLDAGYLSRILQDFAAEALVNRERSADDARRIDLSLTAAGKKAFRNLDRQSNRATGAMLAALSHAQRERLVSAMRVVQQTLSEPAASTGGQVIVRTYQNGDLGWAIEQHARVYSEEFGWNEQFEALVATLMARFATHHDPTKEQFWIAEVEGERVGCVFVTVSETDPAMAQLRCLLVAPTGRGLGVGRRLVQTCLDFAKSVGYVKMMLWTNDILVSARRIYQAAGFELVEQAPHHSFGHDLVGQTWMRTL